MSRDSAISASSVSESPLAALSLKAGEYAAHALDDVPSVGQASTDASTPKTDTSKPRFAGIDAMRALSILGVIWIHTVARTPLQGWNALGRFGAEYFAAVAVFLTVFKTAGSRPRPFGDFVAVRFNRLILPFAGWCAIYLALIPVLGFRGANHLWFLPFIFVCVIGAWPLSLLVDSSQAIRIITAAALVVLGLLLASEWVSLPLPGGSNSLALAVLHAWTYVPGALWGAAIALLCQGRLGVRHPPVAFVIVGSLLAIGSIWMLLKTGRGMDPIYRNLAGCGCLLLAIGIPQAVMVKSLNWTGRSAYGIYLVHPCIGLALVRISEHVGTVTSVAAVILRFILVVVLSLALTKLLERQRAFAWLIPRA